MDTWATRSIRAQVAKQCSQITYYHYTPMSSLAILGLFSRPSSPIDDLINNIKMMFPAFFVNAEFGLSVFKKEEMKTV